MKKTPQDELEQARTIASKDGNAFHARVATYLRNKDWTVLLSPYYVDNATGQAREIDLLCERVFPFQLESGGNGALRLQLFIECKYITGPVVFWFDDRDQSRAEEWLERNTPFRKNVPRSHRAHHYIAIGSGVAKLFKSEGRTDGGHDPFYKALAQSLGALIQRRGAQHLVDLDPQLYYGRGLKVDMTIAYPVIVCSDGPGFYCTQIDEPGTVIPAPDRFQLEVDYAYTASGKVRSEYFLIDVVRFGKLDAFLQALNIEVKEAALLLSNQ